MKWRLLLLPIAWLYGLVTWTRNKFYDYGIFKTYIIPIKSIAVGNLSVGGTGKSPLIIYIADLLLDKKLNIATLSRGYGRSTKGYLKVECDSNASLVGDEPLQFKKRYNDKLSVHVCENREQGIENILKEEPKVDVILLDDAFQHRAVQAGVNILVTPFDDIYTSDFMLPAGNLRESASGAKRADHIIVSKSPSPLQDRERHAVVKQLNFKNNSIHFSSIEYSQIIGPLVAELTELKNILLVTGIGNSSPLVKHLQGKYFVEHIEFKDHHQFTGLDIQRIHEKFDTFAEHNKIILTTEKDYTRLNGLIDINGIEYPWHYQPIEIRIDDSNKFKEIIDSYVEQN